MEEIIRSPNNDGTIERSRARCNAVVALTDIGNQLLQKGQEIFAMSTFDAALSILRNPFQDGNDSDATTRQLEQQVEWSQNKLEMSVTDDLTLDLSQDAPDVYRDDECDVGPRPFHAPMAVSADETMLMETCLLYNKALTYQCTFNHTDAVPLYEAVIHTVLNTIATDAETRAPSTRGYFEKKNSNNSLLLNLALRAHNNLGRICYIETCEDHALSHFAAAWSYAKELMEKGNQSKIMSLDFATVLSNLCRISWMRNDTSHEYYAGLQEILQIRSRHLGNDHIDVASAHYNLGIAEYSRGCNKEAAMFHLQEFLRIYAQYQQQSTATSMGDKRNSSGYSQLDPIPALVSVLFMKTEGKNDEMSKQLVGGLQTLESKRKNLGPNSYEVAPVLSFLGTILFQQNDFVHALLFFLEELKVKEEINNHQDLSFCVTCNNIGRTLQELQNFPQAIHYYRRALNGDLLTSAYQAFNTTDMESSWAMKLNSTIWYNLGVMYDKSGEYRDAIEAFQTSLNLRKILLGPIHPDVACLLYNIAVLQMQEKLLTAATNSINEVLKIRTLGVVEGSKGGQLKDENIIKTLQKLAQLQKSNGNLQASLDALREACIIQQNSYEIEPGQRQREMGITLTQIAELYHEQGELKLALITAEESVRLLRADMIPEQNAGDVASSLSHFDCAELVSALLLLGSLIQEHGEPTLASSIFSEAVLIIDGVCGRTNCTKVSALHTLREVSCILATSYCAPVA